ncbi:MAG: T9SS type A sorting domain-containing protein, partial [Bacteroidales bacterium]|nr:T9SS type A sorting domain-containing protein [Bacteroidales bacterium]
NFSGGKVNTLASAGTITLKGGTFDTDYDNFCADGYLAVGRAGNIWTVEIAEVQKRGLIKGWNWVSHYVIRNEVNDSEILEDLMTQVGGNLLQVHNGKDSWTSNMGGDLETTTVTEMYKVQTNMKFDEISFTGVAVDPSKCPITLKNGWNYMGYPTSVEIPVATAFPNAVSGDWVKSQRLFAEFYNGTWYGPLTTMTSGEGYMYKNNGSETTVKFVANTNTTRGAVEANITTDNNYWTVDATQFANNMSMVATLGADSENYELAAFVNGEVRGSARPIYVEALDAYMFFLTIHGEGVEEVTFKCYDIDTDTEYTLNEGIVYSSDAILGSVREPYVLRGTLGMDEVSANAVAIYPNPTTTANEIMLSTTCDKVEVFNSLGVKVAEYQNVNTIEALETAGVYVIRVTNNDNVQNCRLVVK